MHHREGEDVLEDHLGLGKALFNVSTRVMKLFESSVARTVKSKYDWDFHAYGNVSGQAPERSWTTVEDLPRYSHNYWGVRNRFGILSETYGRTYCAAIPGARFDPIERAGHFPHLEQPALFAQKVLAFAGVPPA